MAQEGRGMKRGLTFDEISGALKLLNLSERDERRILHHTEITDLLYSNHQCCFLDKYLREELKQPRSANQLSLFFKVTPYCIRKWLANGPMDPKPLGRHLALDEITEKSIIEVILAKAQRGEGMTQRELLNYVYDTYGISLTRGWVHNFLYRHNDELKLCRSFPQEDSRMLVPREYLKEHLLNLWKIFEGRNAEFIFNLDELGYSDWESRYPKKVIVGFNEQENKVFHAVKRSLAHMSLLACITAAGDSLTPMLITKYPDRDEIWEDGLRPDEDVALRQRNPPYMDNSLFYEYIKDILIPYVKSLRGRLKLKKEPALLLMDSCLPHCNEEVLQLLGRNNIIVYAFPSHTSNLFQPCDLSLFGTLKAIQKSLKREENESKLKDYITKLLKAFEASATSFNIRSSFRKAGLGLDTSKRPYTIVYRPEILKENPGFHELWTLNIKTEDLSARRINHPFGVINEKCLPTTCPIYTRSIDSEQEMKILDGLQN